MPPEEDRMISLAFSANYGLSIIFEGLYAHYDLDMTKYINTQSLKSINLQILPNH